MINVPTGVFVVHLISPLCFGDVWENPFMLIVDHMKNYGASLHDAVPAICIENHM